MNSDSMPKELDAFISILGEIDMIKNQIGMLDKNTHINLSQNDVSAILGNSECFKILKLIEILNSDISNLNASLLNAAQLISAEYVESKSTKNEEKKTKADDGSYPDDPPKDKSTKENKKENETISNMLQYFKERFESNGRE